MPAPERPGPPARSPAPPAAADARAGALPGLTPSQSLLPAAEFFARFAWERRLPDEGRMSAEEFLDAL